MENSDTNFADTKYDEDEEELFMKEVVKGEYDLLFLDSYLSEMFSNRAI